jgi:hypothetical protein
MGTLTVADFENEILAGLGNRSDITTDRIVIALNLAQQRIARSYDFSELATTSFAQMNFTGFPQMDKYMIPPADTKTIHSFVVLDTSSGQGSLGQSRKVVEKPWRWFDAHYPAPEWLPAGWPSIYKRWGNTIVMVPAPFLQFTAQLSYTRYPLPFSAAPAPYTTQISEFENKDDVLIEYSLAYFFKGLGRNDRAVYFEGLAKEQLDEAIERDDTRPDIEASRDMPAVAGMPLGPYWSDPWVKSSP